MPVSRSASVARYWNHMIHENRCQFVDFRHAFLELQQDRIREVVSARARACTYTCAYNCIERHKNFLQIRRKA